jgi:bifunctional oligoribonuclease and PAP phosphatase NrnA
MTVDWPAFVVFVNSHQSFILTSHIRPDCDALGSELGMANILRALGKKVRIVNGQATPPNLAFIDPEEEILVIGEDVTADDLADADALLVLDTSAWAQLGPMGDIVRTTNADKGVLDHHVGEDDLGAQLFKNTTAEAAGRLVVEAAEQLNVQLTAEMARPLFAAIATDTGWYRFGSASAYTYRIAANLIDAGASPSTIYGKLYERETLGRLRLRGLVLHRTVVEENGLGFTHILREDFDSTGALPSDTEDLVNLILSVEGSQAAVIFVQQQGSGYKISFRSRCRMDCSQVAAQFGGGGHKAAAGAFIEGELDDVRPPVLEAVRAAM